MERVILVGSEDVARAGSSISFAADQMQRAANTIDSAMVSHAARLEDLDLRAAQRAEERPTLRDEFAMRAMQTLVGGEAAQHLCDNDSRYDTTNFAEVVAVNAYEFADAMLKARSA